MKTWYSIPFYSDQIITIKVAKETVERLYEADGRWVNKRSPYQKWFESEKAALDHRFANLSRSIGQAQAKLRDFLAAHPNYAPECLVCGEPLTVCDGSRHAEAPDGYPDEPEEPYDPL